MARGLRIQYAGAWYHLTARGSERGRIFRDDRDRLHFLGLLEAVVERFALRLCAYVLMDNHYHLLVQLREPNLSRAMQWLGQSYGTWFNRRHGRVGPLVQGRFKGILVDGEVYGGEVSRYLHLNPVRLKRYGLEKRAQQMRRAGVVAGPLDPRQVTERLERLRQYRWSSYPAYVGWAPTPGWLDTATVLTLLGGSAQRPGRAEYRRYVEAAVREGLAESPWERAVGGWVLGGTEFVRQLKRWLKGDRKEQPGLEGLRERPSWEQVRAAVEGVKAERWERFRDRHGDWGRDLALYLGRRHCGLTLRELGERAGGMDYRGVAQAVKRFAARLPADKQLLETVNAAERRMRRSEH